MNTVVQQETVNSPIEKRKRHTRNCRSWWLILCLMGDGGSRQLAGNGVRTTTAFSSMPLVPSQTINQKRNRGRSAAKAERVGVNSMSVLCASQGQENDDIPSITSRLYCDSNSTILKAETNVASKVNNLALIPSQVIRKSLSKNHNKRKDKVFNQLSNHTITENSQPAASTKPSSRPRRRHKILYGNHPNLFWGAIPMDELRSHPSFDPLPQKLTEIRTLDQVNQFRQDSWQWDVLHQGRITTSILASSLGLLNPRSAKVLGVPRSLQHQGARRAWERWNEEPLFRGTNVTADQLIASINKALLNNNDCDSVATNPNSTPNHVWTRPSSSLFQFAAEYNATTLQPCSTQHSNSAHDGNPVRIRMQWGTIQEATAILTALNYFTCHVHPAIRIQEIGMCLLLTNNGTNLDIPPELEGLLGASPDALIVYPPETPNSPSRVEVLEVKNHCPFVNNVPQGNRSPSSFWNRKHRNYAFRTRAFYDDQSTPHGLFEIPPHYIPQLMMEMACVGPQCRSAIMVRQTATDGAVILRLHRNDAWLQEMLFWLMQFRSQFVVVENPHGDTVCGAPPPVNFFWLEGKVLSKAQQRLAARYRKFVIWTRNLGQQFSGGQGGVELVAHLHNHEIQRVGMDANADQFYKSLFLDKTPGQ